MKQLMTLLPLFAVATLTATVANAQVGYYADPSCGCADGCGEGCDACGGGQAWDFSGSYGAGGYGAQCDCDNCRRSGGNREARQDRRQDRQDARDNRRMEARARATRTWNNFAMNWCGGCAGNCALCRCCATKGSGDSGWAPPARLPVNRDGIWFQNYSPQAWYGTQGGGFVGNYPTVYQPTDTTQLGYTYAKVPTWRPNPGMIPQTPCPSMYHARVCPPDETQRYLGNPCSPTYGMNNVYYDCSYGSGCGYGSGCDYGSGCSEGCQIGMTAPAFGVESHVAAPQMHEVPAGFGADVEQVDYSQEQPLDLLMIRNSQPQAQARPQVQRRPQQVQQPQAQAQRRPQQAQQQSQDFKAPRRGNPVTRTIRNTAWSVTDLFN